jgi:hypothetical protein
VSKPRSGCLRGAFRAFLVLAALALGGLAWDVAQLRTLRPPDDRTFEGFVRSGRTGSLLIEGDRLFWVAPPARTIVPYPEPPVYEFDRSGRLVNWTPQSGERGMLVDAPVRRRGSAATLEEARAWLLGKEKRGKSGGP